MGKYKRSKPLEEGTEDLKILGLQFSSSARVKDCIHKKYSRTVFSS